MPIFERNDAVGSFAGFSESGLEFHSDIVVPYDSELQNIPLHGQFVVVQLADDNEALLGRITTVRAQGRLTTPLGEDFAVRQVLDDRPIPDDMRRRFLKYRIDIRILGVVRERGDSLSFVPSHRRVPHVGAKVAFLSDRLLGFTVDAAGTDDQGEREIGFYTLGEFVYAGTDRRIEAKEWMTVLNPALPVRFPTHNLASKRSVIFARAGYGKSNLLKILLAATYETPPTVDYRRGPVEVGTIVFDPEGEYFFPDNQDRPGLCDVPHLRDRLVVFTDRPAPAGGYDRFVAGGTRLDARDLDPAVTLSLFFPGDREKPNQQRLSRLSAADWASLFDAYGPNQDHRALETAIENLQAFQAGSAGTRQAEIGAAVRKIERIANSLHDPNSTTLQLLQAALADGRLCVVDISQLRGSAGFNLSALILNRLFEFNQNQFTADNSEAFPVVAVIEEAQSVLTSDLGDQNPFVEWTKEGRKYGLGSILVTQQPGSIPHELVSQADNFFVFHLLAEGDLRTLRAANAHFSDDLLSSLLNEPIAGNGVVWSSASERPYPISVRILDFQRTYPHLLREEAAPFDDTQPYTTALGELEIVSTEAERNAMEDEIDALVTAEFLDALAESPGVRLGRLGNVLKPVIVRHHPDMGDNDAFLEAMNAGRRSAARLAPAEHRVAQVTNDDGKKSIFWASEEADAPGQANDVE